MSTADVLAAPARGRQIDRARLAGGIGAIALAGIVAACAIVVLVAAQGGSHYLSPVVVRGGPGWLAGPLGGLWPGRPTALASVERLLLVDLLAMLALYLAAIACAPRIHPAVLWGAVGAVHVVFLLSPPLLQTDAFNYAQYARMGVLHGLNPYVHIPAQATGDPTFPLSTWTHMRSAYGPLFTLITYVLVPLGVAGSLWAFKLVLTGAGIGLLVLVWKIARRLGRNPSAAVVICGFNPIMLVYGLGGEHNDIIAMVPVLASVYLLVAGRERSGAAAMVGAVALKASAAVLLPVVILAGGRPRRAAAGAAAALVGLAALTVIAFGVHLPSVADQSRLVTLYSVPNTVGYALGLGGETAAVRAVCEALLLAGAIAISVWGRRRRAPVAALGWVTVLTLVTLGWDMPWYLIWLLPFVAFVPARGFRIAATVVIVWMTVQWLPTMSSATHDLLGISPNRTHVWCENQLAVYRLGGLPTHRAPAGCHS